MSTSQLHAQDGIGFIQATTDELPFLFTGNINNPASKLELGQGFNGLNILKPLSHSDVSELIADHKYTLHDFT